MKVLHLGKFYPPHRGGMETHLQCLAAGLRQRVELQVVVANDHRDSVYEIADGVPVHRLGQLVQVAATPLCPRLLSHLRSTRADIVHIHWPNPAAILAWLASGHSGHLVITYHSDVIRQTSLARLFAPALNAALQQADAIIATSPEYIDSSPVLSHWRNKCRVLPLGVAESAFLPAAPGLVNAVRARYPGPLIFSVGRLVYYKGFEYLIRAMGGTAGQLVIAGDGPLRERLQGLIDACGLSSRVFLVSGLSDEEVHAHYAAADVFVLPSVARSEAFGLVQVEAMAASLPVVNTRLPSGVPYVSLHGVSGLTVPPADVPALRGALGLLLSNPELRALYGRGARRRAETEFRSSKMVQRTLDLYESILQPHAAKANS